MGAAFSRSLTPLIEKGCAPHVPNMVHRLALRHITVTPDVPGAAMAGAFIQTRNRNGGLKRRYAGINIREAGVAYADTQALS